MREVVKYGDDIDVYGEQNDDDDFDDDDEDFLDE